MRVRYDLSQALPRVHISARHARCWPGSDVRIFDALLPAHVTTTLVILCDSDHGFEEKGLHHDC